MSCFYCKGQMTETTTVYSVQLGNNVVVVKNVPCLECEHCGEVEFSNEVAQLLDEIVNRAKEALSEVTIIDYQQAA